MFHIGNARTALYNWFYAQRLGGVFVLRIEDTDAERNTPESVDGILEALRWLGVEWNEGPYFQSANLAAHTEAAQQLFAAGRAYYCDCTREVVEQRTKGNATPGYDRHCRDRGLEPGEGRALRFRVPTGRTTVHDLVRGDVDFDNDAIEDFVLVRSNGAVMFVLANVIDDMRERITHVVRGEEHLSNTPKQLLIWEAMGSELEPPVYAHLPLIVNESRKKLSKRRDKVALEMYRDEGYLPEAMRNYLALLGWAPKGDREIVPLQTLVDEFDYVDVQKSSAFFDIKKLDHFNGEYIRALDLEDFIARCLPFLDRAHGSIWPEGAFDETVFRSMASLVQERVDRLDAVVPMVDFFFVDEVTFDEAAVAAAVKTDAQRAVLVDVIAAYEDDGVAWTAAALHECTAEIGERHGLKLGKAQAPVRVAVTGKRVGPPLFESLEVLGRERTLQRLRRLRDTVITG